MDRDCIQPFIVYVYAAHCTTVRALTLTGYTSRWRHVTRDMHAQLHTQEQSSQCLVLTPAYKKFLMLMLTYAYLRLLKETDQSAALTYSYLKKA